MKSLVNFILMHNIYIHHPDKTKFLFIHSFFTEVKSQNDVFNQLQFGHQPYSVSFSLSNLKGALIRGLYY